jgi:hypothetical protein
VLAGLVAIAASGSCEGDCGPGPVVFGVLAIVVGAGLGIGGAFAGFAREPADPDDRDHDV